MNKNSYSFIWPINQPLIHSFNFCPYPQSVLMRKSLIVANFKKFELKICNERCLYEIENCRIIKNIALLGTYRNKEITSNIIKWKYI